MWERCPGIKNLVRPKIVYRTCPVCGEEVEFFEGDTEAECPSCGKKVYIEATPSCVSWCPYALKCIDDLVKRKMIPPSTAEELRKIARKE